MKNTLTTFPKKIGVITFGLMISVLTLMVALPVLVSAQPGSSPPTGVVDANFNSVNVTGNVAVSGSISNPSGVSDVIVNDGLQVNGSSLKLTSASTFTIDFFGGITRIMDNTTSPLWIADTNGVNFAGPLWSGPTFADAKPLVISDADGLRITTYGGTQGLEIAATGDISDSNSAVIFNDSQGVTINSSSAGTGLVISNASGTGYGTLIDNGVTSLALALPNGNAVEANGNITTTGSITAASRIGKTYLSGWSPVVNIPAGGTATATRSCTVSTHVAMGCLYWGTNSAVNVYRVYPSGSTNMYSCNAVAYSSIAAGIQAAAICFDPSQNT